MSVSRWKEQLRFPLLQLRTSCTTCSCEVQNMSNPLHLRQSLFALQARMKVIELHTWQNVQCKAGRLVWNYDRSSSPSATCQVCHKVVNDCEIGQGPRAKVHKIAPVCPNLANVLSHAAWRSPTRPDAQAKSVCWVATCGLRPLSRTRWIRESRRLEGLLLKSFLSWNQSNSSPWNKAVPLCLPVVGFHRKEGLLQKLASKAWHIVFVECFLEKAWTNYDRATEISHLSGVHPWAMRLLAKLRLSMPWPHLFLSISLPPHAPTPASNAKGFCGKNDGTVISGGIATTTASFLRTGHPLHFLWHSPLMTM